MDRVSSRALEEETPVCLAFRHSHWFHFYPVLSYLSTFLHPFAPRALPRFFATMNPADSRQAASRLLFPVRVGFHPPGRSSQVSSTSFPRALSPFTPPDPETASTRCFIPGTRLRHLRKLRRPDLCVSRPYRVRLRYGSRVRFRGLHLAVPPPLHGERAIPMADSFHPARLLRYVWRTEEPRRARDALLEEDAFRTSPLRWRSVTISASAGGEAGCRVGHEVAVFSWSLVALRGCWACGACPQFTLQGCGWNEACLANPNWLRASASCPSCQRPQAANPVYPCCPVFGCGLSALGIMAPPPLLPAAGSLVPRGADHTGRPLLSESDP
jgi:hypothetical protein